MEDYYYYTSDAEDEEELKTRKSLSQNLHDKFKTLEKEYDIFTKSSSNNFMSSLQNHSSYYSVPLTYTTTSNSGQVWKVRTNELANEEMKTDRKLAFQTGKLKGRRLFDDDDEDYQSVFPQLIINVEKGSKQVMNEEKKHIAVNKFDGFRDGLQRKSIVVNVLFGLVLILFVLGICLRFDGYQSGLENILLPT